MSRRPGPHLQKNLALIKLIVRIVITRIIQIVPVSCGVYPHYFNDTVLMNCADLCDYFIYGMNEIVHNCVSRSILFFRKKEGEGNIEIIDLQQVCILFLTILHS